MPWTLVGVASVVEVTTTSHTLVTTGISGIQQGDLLVACFASRIASVTAMTLPTGGEWNTINGSLNNNTVTTTSALPSSFMAYCVRGASNPNLVFTHPVAPSVALGVLLVYRGQLAGAAPAPFDTQSATTTGTNVTAINANAGVLTAQDNELLVALRAGGQESTITNFAAATSPTTVSGATNTTANPLSDAWTERVDSNTLTGADVALSVYDAIKKTAGTTGNITATASQGSGHSVVTAAFKINPEVEFNMPPMRAAGR